MKKAPVSINQLNIGDEIIYKEKYQAAGYPNWKVVSRLDVTLVIIEIEDGPYKERRIVDISDITEIIKSVRE